MPIIQISGLTKDYGHHRGIFNVSFDVDAGECVGFLGPNGAGKSTTIRHLLGFSRPDSGKALLLGEEAFKRRKVLRDVGYLPGEISLPRSLTGRKFLEEQMAIRNFDASQRLTELASFFDVDLEETCRDMSLGSKRKVAILNAFLFDPSVVVLDEPSSGLDPRMQERFLDFLEEKKKGGKTMLFSSHVFAEVERISDRIVIIKDGQIVSTISHEELQKGGRKSYKVLFKDEESFRMALSEGNFVPFREDPVRKEAVYFTPDEKLGDFLAFLRKFQVQEFHPHRETLKEMFLSYYLENKDFEGL